MMWLIGIGGAIGAGSRFLFGKWITKKIGSLFSISTGIINVLGSFILGLLVNFHISGIIGDEAYYLLGVGFCGAFTTFSTFTNEVVMLLHEKRVASAIMYIVSSVILSCIGAFIGLIL